MGNTKSKSGDLVVIGEPSGCLCNQLFIIATTYAYARKNNKRFLIRENWKDISKDKPSYWNNILHFLKQNGNLVYDSQIKKIKDYSYYDIPYQEIPKFNYNILLKGNFQSEKYFKEYKNEICSLFKIPEYYDRLVSLKLSNFKEEITVAVHIRRNESDIYHLLSIDYYNRAKILMEETLGFIPTYLYFSDDPDWVKKNFKLENKDDIIEEKKDYIEFFMMSKCHHFIISNSIFSWWPAYLSDTLKGLSEKIVIAPEYWFKPEKVSDWNDIYPEGCIKVKDYNEGYFEGMIEDNCINLESRYWRDDIIINDDMSFKRYLNNDNGIVFLNDKVNLLYNDKTIDNINTKDNLEYLWKKQNEYIKTRITSLTYNQNNKYDIYMINLGHRNDRKEFFIENFKDYNVNVNHFNAIKHPKGSFGCSLSHLYLVQYAKNNNLPYIITVEDDGILFINNEKLQLILDILTSNLDKWEIFNGSPSFANYMDKFEKCIISESFSELFLETNYSLSSTFIIYNCSIYDKILQNNFSNPIDVYISDSVKQLFLKNEPFSYQINTFSDIDGKESNYNWNVYFKEQYNLLKSKIIKSYDSEYLIPKIVHFVFGLKEQTEEFNLVYALSVISAMLVIKPKNIYFWYHYEPYGIWWDKIKPYLKLQRVQIPTHIGKKQVIKIAHKADIIRMEKLLEYGGIYLDMDTISIKNIDHLLNNEFVIGNENNTGLCNAIMMCHKDSSFLKEWWNQYENNFKTDGWGEASIKLPLKISKNNNNKIFITNEDVFLKPSYSETEKIFEGNQNIPSNLLILHLWESFSCKYYIYTSLEDILEKKCMYGKIINYLNEQYNLKKYL